MTEKSYELELEAKKTELKNRVVVEMRKNVDVIQKYHIPLALLEQAGVDTQHAGSLPMRVFTCYLLETLLDKISNRELHQHIESFEEIIRKLEEIVSDDVDVFVRSSDVPKINAAFEGVYTWRRPIRKDTSRESYYASDGLGWLEVGEGIPPFDVKVGREGIVTEGAGESIDQDRIMAINRLQESPGTEVGFNAGQLVNTLTASVRRVGLGGQVNQEVINHMETALFDMSLMMVTSLAIPIPDVLVDGKPYVYVCESMLDFFKRYLMVEQIRQETRQDELKAGTLKPYETENHRFFYDPNLGSGPKNQKRVSLCIDILDLFGSIEKTTIMQTASDDIQTYLSNTAVDTSPTLSDIDSDVYESRADAEM